MLTGSQTFENCCLLVESAMVEAEISDASLKWWPVSCGHSAEDKKHGKFSCLVYKKTVVLGYEINQSNTRTLNAIIKLLYDEKKRHLRKIIEHSI